MKSALLAESFSDAPRSRAVRSLKQWMDEGVLLNGQPLPPERVLSEKLQVDRGTVRRAIAVLDEQGLLRSHNGRTRIVNTETSQRGRLMQNAIAVLTNVTDEPWTGHRQSGWSDYIGHGASHAIRQQGLHAIALQPTRLGREDMTAMTVERPFGVIITDVSLQSAPLVSWINDLKRRGVPIVAYGGAPALASFDRVVSDHAQGSYLLTKWLISQKRRRILPFWPSPTPEIRHWLAQRLLGYERAMCEAGLEPMAPLEVPTIDSGTYETRFRANASEWATRLKDYFEDSTPVDALMATSDGYVTSVAEACRLAGREPNRDVVLAGYDNYWQEAPEREFEPTAPLATIDKLNLQMGAQLVELLLERIAGHLPLEPQRRLIEPELVVVGPKQLN